MCVCGFTGIFYHATHDWWCLINLAYMLIQVEKWMEKLEETEARKRISIKTLALSISLLVISLFVAIYIACNLCQIFMSHHLF